MSPDSNLHIFQINLNKSIKVHLELMNDRLSKLYEIILIQEPHINIFNSIRTPTNFRAVFPSNRKQNDTLIRSVILLGDIPSCMYPFIYPSYHSHFTFILLYLHSFVIVWLSP